MLFKKCGYMVSFSFFLHPIGELVHWLDLMQARPISQYGSSQRAQNPCSHTLRKQSFWIVHTSPLLQPFAHELHWYEPLFFLFKNCLKKKEFSSELKNLKMNVLKKFNGETEPLLFFEIKRNTWYFFHYFFEDVENPF